MNTLLALWLIAHTGDAVTTHLSLSRGGIEKNPFYTQNVLANDALFAGQAAGVWWIMRRYHPRHPKLMKTITVIGLASSSLAVSHNMRTLHVQR